jgi:hypothetical protein
MATTSIDIDGLPECIQHIIFDIADKQMRQKEAPNVCVHCGQQKTKKAKGRPLGSYGVKRRAQEQQAPPSTAA